ncbi:ATP-binding protein [Qipengyuania citrea]|jgi:signal transduction histidine kinase|uniref:ATP-binding protein n=2 Tax=Erythrobacteraceae TaxID=335929 RepID=UPI003299DEA0
MSLSSRGLFIALPIVAFIIGAMAWTIYRASIADDRADAMRELDLANRVAADTLSRELSLIARTEDKAIATMRRKLARGGPTAFDDIFKPAPDGAFHTVDALWDGREGAGGIRESGIGGVVTPPEPQGQRRAAILAAFETMRQMTNGLSDRIESLYFFSPTNDLLIYAPRRPDELAFYRTAPSDFDFQQAEFSRITSPAQNPAARMRCTSLQRPLYDEEGDNWTTGCMTPVRVDGRHLGSWGISIPLSQLTERLTPPAEGAFTIIVSREGKLIHHSGIAGMDSRQLEANVDLPSSDEPLLRGIAAYVERGTADGTVFAEPLDAYVAARELDAPDWVVLTILPQRVLSAHALAQAQRVSLVALIGALTLGLVLAAVFHRTVALRIARLATRIDRVAATEGVLLDSTTKDEIRQLENAFEKMEDRLAMARSREQRSFDVLVNAAERYAMVLFDDRGQLVRASKGALDLFGEEELVCLGAEWGLAAEAAPSGSGHARPGRQSRIIERTLAGGREVWLEEFLIPLVDEAGAPFGTAYIGHDITEKHQTQRAIEESLLYLELAQSSAQAGHFSLDPETMQLSISTWLRERVGVPKDSISLEEVAELIDESVREETMAAIAQAIATRSEFAFESTVTGADGDPMAVLVRGTAVFDGPEEDGNLVGYYGILQDISDQKEAAEALLRARDEARAEARAKTDLLAVISHEIRTPIAGILGLIDQIRRERSDDERSRALRLVEDSSEALLKTLDATLLRTRNERELQQAGREEFRADDLVERVAELFRPLARRKGLAIDVVAPAAMPVTGQPARIQQILANFVSNAVKFTASGQVTLSCSAPTDGSDRWTFVVEDTGSGIAPERMKTIFEPFGGSAPDSLGRATGSGLGLSITRDLAEQLGGTVTAESAAGGGTRMVLALPLPPVPASEPVATDRGTIAIHLAQASLAVRIEALASEQGFRIHDPAAADETAVDLVVSDDRGIIAQYGAPRAVLIGDSAQAEGAEGTVIASEREVLAILPDLLQEIAHEQDA